VETQTQLLQIERRSVWDHISGLDDLAGVPVMINATGTRRI
jgi:hypothetical protein